MGLSFSGKINNIAKMLWTTATDWNAGTVPATLEVSGSSNAAVVRLKDVADNDNNIDYTTADDYTASDANKIEVSGGQAQLKEGLPTNGTFLARYTTDINATFSTGTGTGTAQGTATVSGGRLVLTNSDASAADYTAVGNADSAQTGTIRFNYIPNYSGTPSATRGMFVITKAASDSTNAIILLHMASTGNIVLLIHDEADSPIINGVSLGTWSPTSGVSYEIELNYNVTAGATRLFINGTQQGLTQTGTGTRSAANIGLLRIGNDQELSRTSNFSIDNFMVFTTVKHTTNYTAPAQEAFYQTTDNLYVDTEAGSDIAPSVVLDWLTSTFTSSIPTNTDARVLFSTDGRSTWKTWNGSAWAAPNSATTRTDATTLANAATNFSALPVGSGTLDARVFLYTSDGFNTPNVSNINVTSDTGYETSGVYVTSIADSEVESLDWSKLSAVAVIPASTTLSIKARASDDSSNMGSYSSAISNQGSLGVSGRYIQFEVTFSGTTTARPELQALGATFDPTVLDTTP